MLKSYSSAQILIKVVEIKAAFHFIVEDYHEDLSDFL